MNSLKAKLFLTSLATIAILVVSNSFIANFTVKTSGRLLESQIENSLMESVRSTAASIAASNEKEYKMLETLASLSEIRNSAVSLLEKTNLIYDAISLDKDYVDVVILDKDGMAWINNGARMVSFAERDYYKVPLETKGRYCSDPFINKITGKMAVFYSVPVFDNSGAVINVIFCVIDGFKLSALASSHKAGKDRPASIISLRTGLTIADEDRSLVTVQNLPETASSGGSISYAAAYKTLMDGISGTAKYSADKKDYIMASARIPGTDWMAVNTVPSADFKDGIDSMSRNIMLSILLFAAASVGSVLFMIFTVTHALRPLSAVRSVIYKIVSGNGDLTQRIQVKADREIAAVVDGFNEFCDKLQKIVSEIKKTKEDLLCYGERLATMVQENSTFVSEMMQNIGSVDTETKNQNSMIGSTVGAVSGISNAVQQLRELLAMQNQGIENASSAVTEMIGNIGSVSHSIEKMAEEFHVLQDDVHNGILRQREVNEQIQKIEQQSKMLNDANDVISSIASQTSLLAMNAAIEAAHAGEAGKGFAVVADEIRKLSENSSAQSKNIGDQLTTILNSISSVVEASDISDKMFTRVSEKISGTGDLVSQIKLSMDEQSEGSKQISEALGYMNDAAGKVKDASDDVDSAREEITGDVETLRTSSESVRASLDNMEKSVKVIEEGDDSLMNIATSISESIYCINSQIDRFKV